MTNVARLAALLALTCLAVTMFLALLVLGEAW